MTKGTDMEKEAPSGVGPDGLFMRARTDAYIVAQAMMRLTATPDAIPMELRMGSVVVQVAGSQDITVRGVAPGGGSLRMMAADLMQLAAIFAGFADAKNFAEVVGAAGPVSPPTPPNDPAFDEVPL